MGDFLLERLAECAVALLDRQKAPRATSTAFANCPAATGELYFDLRKEILIWI